MSAPGNKSRGSLFFPFDASHLSNLPRAGCFQCSKRRIVCDDTQPICLKCQKKGIECSGPGRIRFSNAVALRGRFKGCAFPVASKSGTGIVEQSQHAPIIQPKKIRWKNEQKSRAARKYTKRRANPAECDIEKAAATRPGAPNGPETQGRIDYENETFLPQTNLREIVGATATPKRSSPLPSTFPADHGLVKPFYGARRAGSNGHMSSKTVQQIPRWIAPLSSDIRRLFSHCKHATSPFMR